MNSMDIIIESFKTVLLGSKIKHKEFKWQTVSPHVGSKQYLGILPTAQSL